MAHTKFSKSEYQVEDSPGYLLARARTRLAKSIDLALASEGITHAQGSILMMLASGKYATAADLVRELYIDSASMTRMLDRLEKRNLIERVACESDRRVMNLKLSADGDALAARLPSSYVAVLNRHFAHFSKEETEMLKTLLRKMLATEGLE